MRRKITKGIIFTKYKKSNSFLTSIEDIFKTVTKLMLIDHVDWKVIFTVSETLCKLRPFDTVLDLHPAFTVTWTMWLNGQYTSGCRSGKRVVAQPPSSSHYYGRELYASAACNLLAPTQPLAIDHMTCCWPIFRHFGKSGSQPSAKKSDKEKRLAWNLHFLAWRTMKRSSLVNFFFLDVLIPFPDVCDIYFSR